MSLGQNPLKSLPPALALKHVTRLSLPNCQLTTLPDAIGNLVCLEALRLERNQLRVLPDSIATLPLQRIDLSSNSFKIFPYTLGEIASLVSLDLHSNQIRFIPCILMKLRRLEHLNLDDNPIER